MKMRVVGHRHRDENEKSNSLLIDELKINPISLTCFEQAWNKWTNFYLKITSSFLLPTMNFARQLLLDKRVIT